jgi:hypothetical protein
MSKHTRWLGRSGALLLSALALFGGGGCKDEAMERQLLESSDKVIACQKDLAQAKDQVNGLKHQLAQAMANPSRVELTDPEVIELVASIHNAPPSGGDAQPTLDPKKASEVLMNGATALQSCYERALKKNAKLQTQAGLKMTLGVTVRPSGEVKAVDVAPVIDREMVDCIRSIATRWKFPSFSGKEVTIEQKVTLTPKT